MPSAKRKPAQTTVEALAQLVLRKHIDGLAERVAAVIQENIPDYQGITRDELVSSCRNNLRRSLQHLAQLLPAESDLVDAPSATAALRARQGVPLDALLQSYRLGGRVLWAELIDRAQESGTDDRVLLAASTTVWDIIEAHSNTASLAYRAEEAVLQRRDRLRQEVVLDALLDGAGHDLAFLERGAAVLDMPADVPYVVVATTLTGADEAVHPYEALAARGYSSHWRVRGGIEVGLVPLVAGTVSDLAHALRSSLHAPAALSPEAPGLAHVDRAGQLAETALRTLGPHADVVSFADRLPEVLLVTQPAVAEVLREQLLGPVLQLPTPERKALLATLKATVVEGKTSSAAARSLFCHRNTVLHRLDRVVELTGHRLDDPRSKLLMHLALLSQSLRDDVSSTKS